ncbi:fimbrial protein [Enterobacter cloacae complex sp. I2]|uniref:fimbrial protein n=1 Tax=Enterobacter cloacae complex sp. I2 TaxID=2779603 RepID=UPI001868FFB4|nr:fimbrial protein [Enterobacter cloacae complex sp. I2]MBE3513846.1 fimbrial protein [Enterobacter cloacae complex sp. I2]
MRTNISSCLVPLLSGTILTAALSFDLHAVTILTNCFPGPQDYQISYSRELASSENITGNVVPVNDHLLGSGAEMEASCTCPSDMKGSDLIMELTFAGSPLNAGASGFGYLTDSLDIDVSGYSDAINAPEGKGLTKLEINQYPTPLSAMNRKVEGIKYTEATANVCNKDTRPESGATAQRRFKWNVIAADFLVKKPILGVATIPPTLVVQNYACLYYDGDCSPASAQLVSNIWLSGNISAPLSCTINEGSTIEVDFGDLISSQFVTRGQQPKGFALKDVDISYHCDSNAVGKNDRIKLTLSADQGVVDGSDPVIAKTIGRDDIGVRIFDESSKNVELDGSFEFPVTMDEQGNGVVRIKATPVSTTNAPPKPGSFEGNVTVKMDLR